MSQNRDLSGNRRHAKLPPQFVVRGTDICRTHDFRGHTGTKIQHAEPKNRLAISLFASAFARNGLATFAEKIKQSDESIPSSGIPAAASGAYLRSDLLDGSFA
jgi:hypothetical protein